MRKFTVNAKYVAVELDKWLEKQGYERDGMYYRVKKESKENVFGI